MAPARQAVVPQVASFIAFRHLTPSLPTPYPQGFSQPLQVLSFKAHFHLDRTKNVGTENAYSGHRAGLKSNLRKNF
jgi:hypothetical protein